MCDSKISAMEDNIQHTCISKIQEGASETITWTLQNWKNSHKMLAGESDCKLNIGDVKLSFFFRPFNKKLDRTSCNPALTIDYYSLCVQILSNHKHISLRVKTKYKKSERYDSEKWEIGLYEVIVKKSAKNQDGAEIMDREFFKSGIWRFDYESCNSRSYGQLDFCDDNDDLSITITAILCQPIEEVNSNFETSPASVIKKNKNSISTQIQRVLQDHPEKPFADISLKMQDNVTLQGHRLMLASASPVFEAMFTSGLKETQTGIVEIPDVSSEVMKLLIQYMYTGQVDLSSSQLIEEVIYAASKYQLDGLVEYCDNLLITICNPGNIVGLLKLAKKYNLQNSTVDLQKYMEIHALEVVMNQIKNV